MTYNPTVPLFRLYERTSKNGNTYLSGRLGSASVVAFRSKEPNEHGQYYYDVKVSEPQEKRQDIQADYARPDRMPPERKPEMPDARDRGLNDPIPF